MIISKNGGEFFDLHYRIYGEDDLFMADDECKVKT